MTNGDVVRVKYTGESVVVLDQRVNSGGFDVVDVKHARMTQNGIVYEQEVFFRSELEQVEANIDREFQEGLYRRSLLEKAEKAEHVSEPVVTGTVQ